MPESGEKCGNLQQQLHLHLPGSHPVLHVGVNLSLLWPYLKTLLKFYEITDATLTAHTKATGIEKRKRKD